MGTKKHTVVIVGGGIAGVLAAKQLLRDSIYEVVLISESKQLTYNLPLFQVRDKPQKGGLSIPIEQVFGRHAQDLDLVRAKITKIVPSKHLVRSDKGIDYEYDSLIIATGRGPLLDKMPGTQEAYRLYSASAMEKLRFRLRNLDDTRPQNICILGGGMTGVQMAATIASELGSAHTVRLIESEKTILANEEVNRQYRTLAAQRLKELGVKVITGQDAELINNDHIRLATKKIVPCDIAIDARGQESQPFIQRHNTIFTLARSTLIRVNDLLEADGYSNIYVIGDAAETELSGFASTALYDAEFVVSTIQHKQSSKALERYEAPLPAYILRMGTYWALYYDGENIHSGFRGWVSKRWLDRKHFSTLLSKRLLFRHWLLGVREDAL